MADYYSILKKTISGLAHNSQGTRTAVYAKARTAIDRQLRAMEPTPSEEAIARQMELLEVAIKKLDAEYSQTDGGAQNTNNAANRTSASDQETSVSPPVAPASVAQPVADATTAPVAASAQVAPVTPVAPAVDSAPVGDKSGADPYVPAGTATPTQAPIGAQTGHGQPQAPAIDPQGMDYSETILAVEPDTLTRENSPRKKSGFLSTLIPIVLAIGVIGGGLYALWLNKDALMGGLTGDGAPAVEEKIADDVNADQAGVGDNDAAGGNQGEDRNVRVVGEEAPKNAEKLTASGETVEAQPVAPAEQTSEPAGVEAQPVEQLQADQNNNEGSQQVTEIAEATSPQNQDAAGADSGSQEVEKPAGVQASTTPAVAQKAFLYEEGSSGSDASRDNAAVVWSLVKESIDGGEPEAVIRGQLDVPGRNMTMNLAIKRNLDASLPASHIIELSFQLPGDFAGGNISNVSRFVMKSSEQARGEGLVAVPAKISDGNFLIALNNLDQALETNRKLLLESSWIDVPLGYTTGRRALVTLEKGALGNKVFRDAFADWDKR